MNNLFAGNNSVAKFSRAIYKRLISRKWFAYSDIIADYEGLASAKDLGYSVSCHEEYSELKKAFTAIRKELKKELGDDFIETGGNNRDKKFRYIGKRKNPLLYLLATAAKDSLEVYFQFCQDSSGFIPESWQDYFLSETLDFLDIGRDNMREVQIMESSASRQLKNIELLPYIYECIRDQKVLEISFSAGYSEHRTIIYHPHFLKEFNGRWQIYGYTPDAEDGEPNQGFIISLDRIDSIEELNIPFIEPESIDYTTCFQDIVGFTHVKNVELSDIVIRIYSQYMFNIIDSKPIHKSHKALTPYAPDLGYGEISYTLRPNNEFYGRVLQMGSDLEIISPQEVREEIAKRIADMNNRYE